MNRTNYPPMARGVGHVILSGNWAPNNGSPDNTLNVGDWFTVAYGGSAGLYTVTLRDKFVDVYSYEIKVTAAASTTLYRCEIVPGASTLKTLVSTTGAIPMAIVTGATTLENPDDPVERVYMTFHMKNSTGR